MEQKIFDKVNKCLEKYIGGEKFFDELDKMVKFDVDVLGKFIKDIKENCGTYKTIASGEFGMCLHNYKLSVDIIVQGGLRNGDKILDLSKFVSPGEEYIFLDDSYFSGKTATVVKKEVERCGGKFVKCCVVYDGSQMPIHKVESQYRYYDYH